MTKRAGVSRLVRVRGRGCVQAVPEGGYGCRGKEGVVAGGYLGVYGYLGQAGYCT